jgi:alpha-tubulin suppressor-like RCC1 family protein
MIVPSNVVAVAAGAYHSLFITSDGNLWAMGGNGNGQLGDGTTTDQHRPEQITFTGGVTAIAAGGFHSLFLKTNALWIMGRNDMGQLGTGNPVEVHGASQLLSSSVYRISAGYFHSLFETTDGSLWAMGDDEFGQLGDGSSYTNRYSPVEVLTNHSVFSGVAAISAGTYHSLYIFQGFGLVFSLWAMGDNSYGELGDGSTFSQYSPEEILSSNVTAIAAGDEFTLLIKSGETLWDMGWNREGQLGDGTTTDHHSPQQVIGASNVVAIAAGFNHSVYVESDGSLWGMGYNAFGQLGNDTTNNSLIPIRIVPPLQLVVSGITLSGSNLVFHGNNDFFGGSVVVLSSTNVETPLNQWTPIWTNGLGSGSFSFTATNIVGPSLPQRFYRLKLLQID